MSFLNFEASNKHLVEQIAVSKHLSTNLNNNNINNTSNFLNQSGIIANSTSISHFNHQKDNQNQGSSKEDKRKIDNNDKFQLTKTSTLNDDSISNLSIAFQKYQPNTPTSSNFKLSQMIVCCNKITQIIFLLN